MFHSLANRVGKQKGFTAVVRKLLAAIWHILPTVKSIAMPTFSSSMPCSDRHHLARSQGLPRLEFVTQRLCRFGVLGPRFLRSVRKAGRILFQFRLDMSDN